MKLLNVPSSGAVIVDFMIVFAIVYGLSWIITLIDLQYYNGTSEHLFTEIEFHNLQGIFVVIGAMAGTFVTSLISPKNEVSRALILGGIIIVVAGFGAVRSQTQTLLDTAHQIVFILTIPNVLLTACIVKHHRNSH